MHQTWHQREWLLGALIAAAGTCIIQLPLLQSLIATDEWRRTEIVRESSDEEFYLARIREAADGHPFIGHPYLFERREQAYPLGQLFESVLGNFQRLFDLRLKTVSIISDLLFPFLLIFLTWLAVRFILPDRRWRLLLLVVLFLGAAIPFWKRPISPQAIVLLPLLWTALLLHPSRMRSWNAALRAALIGLMTYSYPYHWTYALATEGIMVLFDAWSLASWKARGKRLLLFLLPFLAVAAPWIVLSILTGRDPAYGETLVRLGLQQTRWPVGPLLQLKLVGTLLLLGIALFLRGGKREAVPLLALLAGGFIVLNQTILTGTEVEFATHYGRFLQFPLWLAIIASIAWILQNRTWLTRIALTAGFGAMLLQTASVAMQEKQSFAGKAARMHEERMEREAIYEALNALPDHQVILTNADLSSLLPLYTSHYPFFAHQTHMYLMRDSEVLERALLQQFLTGERPDPRAVYGSSYLNRALQLRAQCRVFKLFTQDDRNCSMPAEAFLPASWEGFWEGTTFTEEEVLRQLRDAHVGWALLKEPPAILAPYLEQKETLGSYTLFRLR